MRAAIIAMVIPVLGVLATSTPAAARANNKDRARRLFEKGEQHYQQGEFSKALTAYRQAHKTYRHPAFIFNIAQCYRQLKQYAKAKFYYQLFLAEQRKAPNRSEVKKRIRDMSKRISVLRRSQRDKGRLSIITTPAGAAVFVNRVKGAPNATSPSIILVAAGQHLIMIKKAGYKTVTRTVDITARKVTMLSISLERDGSALTPPPDRRRRRMAPPPDRRGRGGGLTPASEPHEPAPTGARSFYKRWWFWTGVGVVLAGVVVGSYAGSTALAMSSEWEDKRGAVDDPEDFKRRVKSFALVSDLMFGVSAAAAVAVTVGAILVAMGRKKERRSATRILPGCGASGCGVWVTGHF